MFPTVVSAEIERALLDYLQTTFHLRDKQLEAALFKFLRDEKTGMFRGPYLDVRLPFRKASDVWERTSPLDYGPPFVPYAHQLGAFERLSARERKPQNTLVTTGTGSGKTECFLFPVLDHCRRARQRGQQGIKAIILYPMNALASDQAERLATLTHGYDAFGRLQRLSRSDGVTVDLGFDGALPTSVEWSGGVEGKLTADYDDFFQLKTLTVNDASSVSFEYDTEGAVTRASGNGHALDISRDPDTGFVDATTLGTVATSYGYSGFGELQQLTANFQGKNAFSENIQRDELGRITSVTEVSGQLNRTVGYSYDSLGRLQEVDRDGVVTTYGYDANGNRNSVSVDGVETVTATYDAQDRIQTFGGVTFDETAHGDLLRRSEGSTALELTYDGLGNLLNAVASTDKTSKTVSYTVDGFGRRVGKQVGGKFSRAWLYRDALRPVSEVTSEGVFSHFVYVSDAPGAPDFILRAGVPFRIVKDHLGSVRFVVNATTGVVAQVLEYDEFGKITRDSLPGFQPFGFAGGLYDVDTGLVRFGARDYDTAAGRWLNKDPIGFNGDQANLYVYAAGDPINNADHTGYFGDFLGWTVSAGSPFAPIVGALFGVAVPSGEGVSVGVFKDFDFSTFTLSLGFYATKTVSIDVPGRVKKGMKGWPFFANLGTEVGFLKSLDAFKGTSSGGVADLGLVAGTASFSGGSPIPATVGGNIAVGIGQFFGLTTSETGVRGISLGASGAKVVK